MKYVRLFSLVISTVFWASAGAQTLPQFNIVKPSTTGVPGEEVRVMKFDPAGNLWTAGRFYFWGEAALGMLSADQLDHQPLPGGGFDTGAWKVWSSVHHPIPSPYINDMEFGAGGVIWIASDGGLTRFDPAAPTEEQRWFTYTPANSPLILNDVRSLALDSHGNLWLTNVSVQLSSGALFRFNPASNVWTQYRVGQELPWTPPWYNVNAVFVGADDHVWLTHSVLGGMAEFNGASWVLHDSPYQMDAMLADLQGNIWVRTSQYGLFKWNGSSWQNWPTVGGTITMTGLGKDRDGVVYVSTWYGGVYKMINDDPVFFVDADNIPRPVIGRPNGDIWINNYGGNGTLGTVRHYTASGQLLRRMQTFNSGLPDYFVDRITRDSTRQHVVRDSAKPAFPECSAATARLMPPRTGVTGVITMISRNHIRGRAMSRCIPSSKTPAASSGWAATASAGGILPRVNLPAFGIGRTLTSILLATMLSPNAQARHGSALVARAFTGSTALTGIT